MPKDFRSRVNAVRAVMDETGLRYTQAAHELDRRTATAGQAGDERRLDFVHFVLTLTVPADADRRELAQVLADQMYTLRREKTGEQYPGRADVLVPFGFWPPEPNLPGYFAGLLLVRAWAARLWGRDGELGAVITDFHAVARAWFQEHCPVPVEETSAALWLGMTRARALTACCEFAAHTRYEDAALPGGWAELMAARLSAEALPAGTAPAPAAGEPGPVTLMDVAFGIPNAPGGLEKTTVLVDWDTQGDLTKWVPQAPIGDPDPVERPYRVVDRDFQGWHERGDGLYAADAGWRRNLEERSYQALVETRGPVRPVDVAAAEECAAIEAALAGAGRKAAASVLVALYRLVLAEAQQGSGERRQGGARYRIMAGREGSWESEVMVRLAWGIGAELAEKSKRYDETAVEEIVRVVTGWVTGPDRYVEVAATLVGGFSTVAGRTGGWETVADRYLQRHQRVGHPDHVVERVQNYLMSQSRTYFLLSQSRTGSAG
ncbi:hypothetical protein [Streptomyces sp. NPDC012825]|uniref:hypothetical protein n=1 Tax=Streptomyces sp. NPDC012825 TaxID=3364851 RepID=UPI003689F894